MEKTKDTSGHAQRVGRQRTAKQLRQEIPIAERLLLTEDEAAALIGVSKWTLRKWKAAGLIAPVKLPLGVGRNLYSRASVDALIAGRSSET